MSQTVERGDVQGLVVRGYGGLRGARYLLGEIVSTADARAWLGRVAVATGADEPGERALCVALTASGLSKLGLPQPILAQFSREFLDGMTTTHRQRILGDVGDSAPAHWDWGAPDYDPVDLLLLVFARDDTCVAAATDEQERALNAAGVRVVHTLDTVEFTDREHFGFRDGISQPRFRELEPASAGAEIPDRDLIATGELLLGYRNEYGRFTPRPMVEPASDPTGALPDDAAGSGGRDLGRDGTYLVLRQLSQDVEGFWSFCERETRAPDGAVDRRARERLAAKMIGRWPSGTPLVGAPDEDRPGEDHNDFAYFERDPHGLRCPIGAHVRRANPRDTLDPAPGTDHSIAVNKRHRILRRGRQYGELAPRDALLDLGPEAARTEEDVGLHFICLVANISRQFEFVQHSWLNDPRFNGLQGEPDPFLGPASPDGRSFTVPARPVRERYNGVPRFVTVRGGAYFFLPGVRALRYLSTLG